MKRVDDQITLELSFSDKSLFHTFTSIPILFEETAKTVLKAKIQHHYNEIKLQANAAQKRLSLVINEVSRKNIALLSLLNRIPTIRSEPLDHSFFPQVDDNLDDTSFENRYMNRLIPQRPVYVMTKIPIQCSASKQQNKFAESVRRPAKRNGLSTSERYRKSKEA